MRVAVRHILALLIAVAVLAVAGQAVAQPVFAKPGRTQFVPLEVDPSVLDGVEILGRDAHGLMAALQPGMPPRLQVFDPSDRAGTQRSILLPQAMLYAGLSWDHASWLVVSYEADAQRWQFFEIDAGALTPGDHTPTPVQILTAAEAPELSSAPALTMTTSLRGQPDGSVCLTLTDGIVCVDLATGQATRRLDVATLESVVPHRSEWYAAVSAAESPPPTTSFELGASTPASDGRVWVVVRQEWQGERTSPNTPAPRTSAVGIVAVDALGEAEVVFGPVPGDAFYGGQAQGGWTPLRGELDRLTYVPALDAVAVHIDAWDLGWTESASTVGTWVGDGLRLIPVGERGTGYLSLTDAVNQHRPIDSDSPWYEYRVTGLALLPSAEGWLVDTRWLAPGSPFYPRVLGTLEVDLDTLDLDSDGVEAAEEAMHGSSDWLADTDNGGTLDGIEIRLDHTSPIDWHDDAALERAGERAVSYVQSPLIQMRLPDVEETLRRTRHNEIWTWGPDGPLCVYGTCYAPDGSVVLEYGEDVPADAAVSADGRYIAWFSGNTVRRVWFEDGRSEQFVASDQLRFGGQEVLVPIDRERVFVAQWGDWGTDQARVLYCELGGDCRVVFDVRDARLDSGLEEVEWWDARDERLHGVYYENLTPVAWDAEHERLQLQATGPLDAWLLAVSADAPAHVVERAHTWAGANADSFYLLPLLPMVGRPLPDWEVRLATGEYLGPNSRITSSRQVLATRFRTLANLHQRPQTVWGDTVLTGRSEDGLQEMVRYERVLEPGDALFLRHDDTAVALDGSTYGYQLFRSGPRGGLMPLWNGLNSDLVDVGGIDVDRHGNLCVADRGTGSLWLFEPSIAATRIPDLPVDSPHVPGLLDCAFDPATGEVLALATDPPRLLRRAADTAELVDEPLPAGLVMPDEPTGLTRRPDGTLFIEDASVRARAWLPDGTEIVAPHGEHGIYVGSELVTNSVELWISRTTPLASDFPVDVDLAVRPDGLIIVSVDDRQQQGAGGVRTRLRVVDPVTLQAHLFENTEFGVGLDLGAGLAIVPGGVGHDPWTGQPIGEASAPSGGGTSGAAVPVPPSDGTELPAEGCCTTVATSGRGRLPMGWALLGVLGLLVGWRRRRRRAVRRAGGG